MSWKSKDTSLLFFGILELWLRIIVFIMAFFSFMRAMNQTLLIRFPNGSLVHWIIELLAGSSGVLTIGHIVTGASWHRIEQERGRIARILHIVASVLFLGFLILGYISMFVR